MSPYTGVSYESNTIEGYSMTLQSLGVPPGSYVLSFNVVVLMSNSSLNMNVADSAALFVADVTFSGNQVQWIASKNTFQGINDSRRLSVYIELTNDDGSDYNINIIVRFVSFWSAYASVWNLSFRAILLVRSFFCRYSLLRTTQFSYCLVSRAVIFVHKMSFIVNWIFGETDFFLGSAHSLLVGDMLNQWV